MTAEFNYLRLYVVHDQFKGALKRMSTQKIFAMLNDKHINMLQMIKKVCVGIIIMAYLILKINELQQQYSAIDKMILESAMHNITRVPSNQFQ